MSEFKADYEWQMQFLPAIKRIVGPLLIEPAAFDLDANECTDLLVLRARDMRIGCRVRRAGYGERYPWQFTIRSRRDSGAKTELQKITDGWGDWLFYGHEPVDDHWFLIDLDAFRAQLIRHRDRIRMGQKPNGDGTHFTWFDVRTFHPADPRLCIQLSVPEKYA